MARLVLIKHSLPRIIASRPSAQWELGQEGKDRCGWLAEQVWRYRVSQLYSSRERKAEQTARILGEQLNLKPVLQDGLEENDRTGFPFFRDKSLWKGRFSEFFAKPDEPCIGRETAHQALERYSESIAAAVGRHPGESLAVVSHGTVISLFVSRHNDVPAFRLWQSLGLPSYIVLELPSFRVLGGAVNYPLE